MFLTFYFFPKRKVSDRAYCLTQFTYIVYRKVATDWLSNIFIDVDLFNTAC